MFLSKPDVFKRNVYGSEHKRVVVSPFVARKQNSVSFARKTFVKAPGSRLSGFEKNVVKPRKRLPQISRTCKRDQSESVVQRVKVV